MNEGDLDYQSEREKRVISKVYPNYPIEFVDLVLEMISLVSCSKNVDSLPPTVGETWKLIPRYADRLEAIGEPGL